MRRLAIACALLALACGSKKKNKEPEHVDPKTSTAPEAATPSTGDLHWQEPMTPQHAKDELRPAFEKGDPPPEITDPDAVIARFESQCPDGASTPACDRLRAQVEEVFFHDLMELRGAGEPIDREWYRVAARAQLPWLACLGVFALASSYEGKPEDDAVFVAAVESPARSVRQAALGAQVPALADLRERVASSNAERSPAMCLDGTVDKDPGIKWAGGYPGTKFRYFASNASQRWFTTSDPVDKVLAYFAKTGHPAMTEQELGLSMQQEFLKESQKIAENAKPGEEDKMNQQVTELAMKLAFASIGHLQGAGEVRYVMIGKHQAIGIFKDDLLRATSIVAMRGN